MCWVVANYDMKYMTAVARWNNKRIRIIARSLSFHSFAINEVYLKNLWDAEHLSAMETTMLFSMENLSYT